jgi:tetrahydromethanopterin S-methyltransferase subunit D
MRKFLISELAQSYINIVLALYVLIGMMIGFVDTKFLSISYTASALASLILFLIYNYWISEELYKHRKLEKSR